MILVLVNLITGGLLGILVIFFVCGLLIPRRVADDLRAEMRDDRRRNGYVPRVVAAASACTHPEVVDVTSPVYPGEVVARLCVDPKCFKQLPADFVSSKEMADLWWPKGTRSPKSPEAWEAAIQKLSAVQTKRYFDGLVGLTEQTHRPM